MKERLLDVIKWGLILVIAGVVLCFCSGNNKDTRETIELSDVTKALIEGLENTIKYRLNLLCFKHEISSEIVKQDLFNLIKSQSLSFQVLDGKMILGRNKREEKEKEILLQHLSKTEKVEAIDKLKVISTRHNVPVKTLASLLYDYEIWETVKSIEGIQ